MEPGHLEKRGNFAMEAGKRYQIRIDALSTTAPAFPPPASNVPPQAPQIGFFENMPSLTIASCEELARESDISIVFTGNNFEFESLSECGECP